MFSSVNYARTNKWTFVSTIKSKYNSMSITDIMIMPSFCL